METRDRSLGDLHRQRKQYFRTLFPSLAEEIGRKARPITRFFSSLLEAKQLAELIKRGRVVSDEMPFKKMRMCRTNPLASGKLIMSAEEWLRTDPTLSNASPIIGEPENPLVRPMTKNLIEAGEKEFKSTFAMRICLGLSVGKAVFPSLPIGEPRRVLYLHGELSPSELKERVCAAAKELARPLDNFFQGQALSASLVTWDGQEVISELVKQYKPELLVLDPWQSFIAGVDENSFKDISAATRFLDGLIAEFKLAVLLPIHLGAAK